MELANVKNSVLSLVIWIEMWDNWWPNYEFYDERDQQVY